MNQRVIPGMAEPFAFDPERESAWPFPAGAKYTFGELDLDRMCTEAMGRLTEWIDQATHRAILETRKDFHEAEMKRIFDRIFGAEAFLGSEKWQPFERNMQEAAINGSAMMRVSITDGAVNFEQASDWDAVNAWPYEGFRP